MNIKETYKLIKYYKKMDNGLSRVFSKFALTRTPLKKIVNTPIYNHFYQKAIDKKHNKMNLYMFTIEIATICNAKCMMCPYTKMKRKKEIMSQETFEKSVDAVMNNEKKIEYIKFTGLGDPLVDKGFIEKIKYLNKKYPKIKIVIFTNAGLLTPKISQELLDLKIHKINFSVNGLDAEDYYETMELDFDKTMKNIKTFISLKSSSKNKPIVNISSLLTNQKQKDGFDRFSKEWSKYSSVDSVTPCIPSNWSGNVGDKFAKHNLRGKTWPCTGLWKEIFVNVKGDVVLCHLDYECEIKIGNLIKDSYSKIKQELQKIRNKHLTGNLEGLDICANCESGFDCSVDWWGNIIK